MSSDSSTATSAPLPLGWNIALWIVQVLLGLMFVGTGIWKVATPIAELAQQMPWMGEVSPTFFYATAVFDTLGGIGIVLPSLTRIRPHLGVLAALGIAVLMASAVVFHLSRGEGESTPFNFVVMALALFVAWGRHFMAPIAPRRHPRD